MTTMTNHPREVTCRNIAWRYIAGSTVVLLAIVAFGVAFHSSVDHHAGIWIPVGFFVFLWASSVIFWKRDSVTADTAGITLCDSHIPWKDIAYAVMSRTALTVFSLRTPERTEPGHRTTVSITYMSNKPRLKQMLEQRLQGRFATHGPADHWADIPEPLRELGQQ